MREKVLGGFMLLVLVYLMVQLSGCTLIGMGLGSLLDNVTPKESKTLYGDDIAAASPGKKVTIVLRSGTSLDGTFFKFYQLSRDEYAPLYPQDERLGSGALRLPRLGEKLSVVQPGGKTTDWEFYGFDLGGTIALRRPATYFIVKMSLNDIHGLRDAQGELLNVPFLKTSLNNAQVPFMTAVWLLSEKGKVIIPSDQILEIRMEKGKSGKTIGMVIGMVLDAYVIVSYLLGGGYRGMGKF